MDSGKIIQGAKSTTVTYDVSLENIKAMIARDLEVDVHEVQVEYVIREVGGDYLDRYPGTKQVTSVRVTVTPNKA